MAGVCLTVLPSCVAAAAAAAAAAAVAQGGRVPEQKIKLRHGDTLLIDTMEGNTMMNWLKRFLAGGFQVGEWVLC
jgi:hypothetical protein